MDGWSRTGDGSGDRCGLAEFTDEQQVRLTQVLDEYLIALERGAEPDRAALIAKHPDLAEQIVRYLDSLKLLQGAAGGFHASSSDNLTPGRPPSQIGTYRILREIGRGGMAIVYEAHDESLGRTVALKVLPYWAVRNEQQIARFRNEAHSLAQLQHPNIVPVYATGEEAGVHYFAMRLIDGLPLDRVVEGLRQQAEPPSVPPREELAGSTRTYILQPGESQAGPPETSPGNEMVGARFVENLRQHPVLTHFPNEVQSRYVAVARLLGTIAHALHAAHRYGIVHRDVKPSNLLIDTEGTAWVADFGLARNQAASHVTGTGDLVGTLRYMSPEQVRGDAPFVDHRSDIYSLGITLYELVTLQPAYGTVENGPRLLDRMEHHDFPRPRAVASDIPEDLENVILKATAHSPEDRYVTAAEFAGDLQRFADGLPTLARRPGILEQLARWTKRRRRTAASLAIMTVLLLLTSMISACLIYRQKLATEAALQSSLHHFRKTRSVVDHLGAQFAEQLALVPGTEQIRRSLLMETIDYYHDLIEDSAPDDGLEVDLAIALNKMALLTEHVGTLDEALDLHRQALAAFQRLAEDAPGSIDHRAKIALCQNNIALLLTRLEEPRAGEQTFHQAISLQRELLERTGDPALRRDLGLSLNNYGLLLCGEGRAEEAIAAFEEAIQLCGSDADRVAEDPLAWRYLAATYANLAELQSADDPNAAVASYEHSLHILNLLAEEVPHSPNYQRDLALTWNNLAALHSRIGNHAEAARTYRAALTIHQFLLNASPHMPEYRRDMAVCENNVALALARAGRHQEAEGAFRRAIGNQQQLVSQFPNDLHDVSSLGGIWNNLGMVLERQEQPLDAIDAYRQAIHALERVVSEVPEEPQHRRFLGRAYANMIRLLRQQHLLDKAFEYLLKSRDLWREDASRLLTVAEQLAELSDQWSAVPETVLDSQVSAESGKARCEAAIAETLRMAIDAGIAEDVLETSSKLATRLETLRRANSVKTAPGKERPRK